MSDKTMRLITSEWNGIPTFKMIPVSKDCPFNEVIFDPSSNVLAIVSKEIKETFHMVQRLDQAGDPIRKKGPTQAFQQQRVTLDNYYEYYIIDLSEIREFVRSTAINDLFDYAKYFSKDTETSVNSEELLQKEPFLEEGPMA